MIIVSDDKTYFVNFDNVTQISIGINKEKEYGIIVTTTNDDEFPLAVYETKERAKEILEEIVNKYLEYGQIQNLVGDIKQVCNIPKKYEMPKE